MRELRDNDRAIFWLGVAVLALGVVGVVLAR